MVVVAKFKTHVKKRFPALQPFRPGLPSKFVKSDNMIPKKFLSKSQFRYNTVAEFESVEKVAKNSCEKSYQQKSDRKRQF
jgi:hypothetical protein